MRRPPRHWMPASLLPARRADGLAGAGAPHGGTRRGVWPLLLLAGALGLQHLSPEPAYASYEERLSTGAFAATPSLSGQARAADFTVSRTKAGGLVHKGRRGEEPRLDSAGSDIALAYALPLLAPEGWSVSGGRLAPTTPVSWDASQGWIATLERLARETGTRVVVDWDDKSLVVTTGDEALASGTGQTPSLTQASAQGQKASRASQDGTARVEPLVGQGTFESGSRQHPAAAQTNKASSAPSNASGTSAKSVSPESLVVSHHGGYGLVYLARPMTAERAAKVFDVKLENLLSWNGIASKGETLPEGRALWLKDPKGLGKDGPQTRQAGTPSAAANAKSSKAKSSRAQSGKARADTTDRADVDRALAKARNEKNARAGASQNAAPTGPVQASLAPDGAWTLYPGSLHDQVEAWANRAGWTLVWQADTDLAMQAKASFAGTFPEVVRALFLGLRESGAPYQARLFHGNRVLQVEDR